jgi:hypothetical protein
MNKRRVFTILGLAIEEILLQCFGKILISGIIGLEVGVYLIYPPLNRINL